MSHPSIIRQQRVKSAKLRRARALRRKGTLAERVLWSRLRGQQFDGYHFRRQQVIAGFVADFYCNSARLAVEIDGEAHQDQAEYDRARDSIFRDHGIRVLRLANDTVISDIEGALAAIRTALRSPTDQPQR